MASTKPVTHVSVRSVRPAGNGLWSVLIRTSGGRLVAMVMSYDDCQLAQVIVSAAAVDSLQRQGRLP